MGARGEEERGRGALRGGGGSAAQEVRDRVGADPADEGEGVREEPEAVGLADRAVPAEDGGAAAVARHIGQQSEGRPEDEGAAHDEVPAGHFSGEGKECFFLALCGIDDEIQIIWGAPKSANVLLFSFFLFK